MRFPDGFRWGAATSSYQIEGAVADDGRRPSIWDAFCAVPGAIADGTSGDVACDHYHRYADDVAIMAGLGLHDYRFSVAWPRVQPDGRGAVNEAGLDFYSRLVDALLDNGVRPLVTLYHWDLPLVLQDRGGWLERDTAARFADYAGLVASRLGDRVQTFTTLNEPWCSAFLGYASGEHAPGVKDDASAYRAAHHLLLAHGLAAPAVRAAVGAGAQVSITLNLTNPRPVSPAEPDVQAARRVGLASNEIFLEPLRNGRLDEDLVRATSGLTDWSFVHVDDLETISAHTDFLGINYYNPHPIGAEPDPAPGSGAPAGHWPGVPGAYLRTIPGPHTGMGWPVDPASFTELLVTVARDYPGWPIVVTENGSAYPDTRSDDGRVHDSARCDYLRGHVGAVHDAITAGVDIRGYFAWSLLDNFEWAWGLAQRFGIVHVDFDTLQRTPKDSALLYRQVIADHGLPAGE